MENHYIQEILHYLRLNPHMGFLFAFVVAFSESLPLIGTIVPGTVTMTAVGILVGIGALPPTITLLIATLAAFMGDTMGYLIGYYYNERLRSIWPFKKHPRWLTMGESFFKKHGGKSIIMGRFIGPARSTVPLIAGLLRMAASRFCVAALPSAGLWAMMYTAPGILLGALSREIPAGETTRFLLYGVGILAIIWLTFWLIQHFFIQLARGINKITDRCWNYLTKKHAGRFLIRLITNQQNPHDHHQLTLSLIAIITSILFLLLFFKIQYYGVWETLNYPLFHFMQNARTLLWDKIFVIITIMGAPKTITLISFFCAIILVSKKQWRTAAHIFAGYVASASLVFLFKTISHSQRPQGFEFVASSSSFPSGHTTLSLVTFGLIAFFIVQLMQKKSRWISYVIAGTLVFAITCSRLYLGAHWLTDIIGSILLGFSIILFCIVSYRRLPNIKQTFHLKFPDLAMLFLFGVILPWCIFIPTTIKKDEWQYTPQWPTQFIAENAWWQTPLQYTPLYRNNRIGKPFQPFNVQWVGSLTQIKKTLKNHGWKLMPEHVRLKTTLQRFASYDAEYHIPILPWLYHNKPPALFFIKMISKKNRIIELRLWKSHIYLKPNNDSLWLGATNIRVSPKKLLSLREKTIISLAHGGGLRELKYDTTAFQQKIIRLPIAQQSTEMTTLDWDGNVLLIRR